MTKQQASCCLLYPPHQTQMFQKRPTFNQKSLSFDQKSPMLDHKRQASTERACFRPKEPYIRPKEPYAPREESYPHQIDTSLVVRATLVITQTPVKSLKRWALPAPDTFMCVCVCVCVCVSFYENTESSHLWKHRVESWHIRLGVYWKHRTHSSLVITPSLVKSHSSLLETPALVVFDCSKDTFESYHIRVYWKHQL